MTQICDLLTGSGDQKTGKSTYFYIQIFLIQKMNNSGNSNKNLLFILLLLLLAGGGLFYIWNNNRALKEESQRILLEKEVQVQQALKEIGMFKGQNEQLDSLVAVAQQELSIKSASMDSMLAVNRLSERQLKKFKEENKQLLRFKEIYLRKIDSLIQANQQLVAENSGLKVELSEERLASGKLKDENASLNSKVALGSMLKVRDLKLNGVRQSGKTEKVISKAKRVDKVKICMTLLENALAKNGARMVYLRILDADGIPMYEDGMGSGSTTMNGKEFKYTAMAPVDYRQTDTPLCVYWKKSDSWSAGSYTAEVYCDGFMLGSTALTLK